MTEDKNKGDVEVGALLAGGRDAAPDLSGAVIVRLGAPKKAPSDADGGGLVIDYQVNGGGEIQRLVLDFNECGMWVVSNGPLASAL